MSKYVCSCGSEMECIVLENSTYDEINKYFNEKLLWLISHFKQGHKIEPGDDETKEWLEKISNYRKEWEDACDELGIPHMSEHCDNDIHTVCDGKARSPDREWDCCCKCHDPEHCPDCGAKFEVIGKDDVGLNIYKCPKSGMQYHESRD